MDIMKAKAGDLVTKYLEFRDETVLQDIRDTLSLFEKLYDSLENVVNLYLRAETAIPEKTLDVLWLLRMYIKQFGGDINPKQSIKRVLAGGVNVEVALDLFQDPGFRYYMEHELPEEEVYTDFRSKLEKGRRKIRRIQNRFDLNYWRENRKNLLIWLDFIYPVFNLFPNFDNLPEDEIEFDRKDPDNMYLLQMIVFNVGNAFTRELYNVRSFASQDLATICNMDFVAYAEVGDSNHQMIELSMRQAKRIDSSYPLERPKPVDPFIDFFQRAKTAYQDPKRGFRVGEQPLVFSSYRIYGTSLQEVRDFFAKCRSNIAHIDDEPGMRNLYELIATRMSIA